MGKRTIPVMILALAVLPVFAEKNIVGEAAPDFSIGNMINDVPERSLEDCRGDVILIKYWGIN